MKKMLAIIKENKRRLKTNIGINRVEEILLNYREKVLFIDKICLRMIIMSKLIGRIGLIEFENYSTLS